MEIYGDLKPKNYEYEIAQDIKEAKKLIEQGLEYMTGEYDDGGKLFRKLLLNT